MVSCGVWSLAEIVTSASFGQSLSHLWLEKSCQRRASLPPGHIGLSGKFCGLWLEKRQARLPPWDIDYFLFVSFHWYCKSVTFR